MSYARIEIPVKGKSVEIIENIITLNKDQIDKIKQQSPSKTEKEWLSPNTKAIRVKMTEQQIQKVINWKNTLVEYITPDLSAEALLKSRKIGFTEHATDRIDERLLEYQKENSVATAIKESLGFLDTDKIYVEASSPEVQMEILNVFIHSNELDNYFEWKAYPHLTFKFKGTFRKDIIGIAVVLSKKSLIVTITIEESHGFNTGIYLSGK